MADLNLAPTRLAPTCAVPQPQVTGLSSTYVPMSQRSKIRSELASAAPLRTFRAAFAKASTTPTTAVWLGDSLTEGQGATVFGNRAVDVFSDLLQQRQPISGVGRGIGYIHAAHTENTFTWPVTSTGGIDESSNAFGYACYASAMNAGATNTFTVKGYTSCKLAAATPGSIDRTLQVTINGTPASSWNAGQATPQECTSPSYTLTGGTDVITVTAASGNAGAVFFEGLYLFSGNETKGVRTIEAGHYGFQAQYYMNNSNWLGRFTADQPSLIVIPLSTNEYHAALYPASTIVTAFFFPLVQALTAACTVPPSIVLVLVPEPYSPPAEPGVLWSDYGDAFRAVQESFTNVGVLDMTLRLPGYNQDPTDWISDGNHWTDRLHAAVGQAVADFVLP